MLFKDKYYVVFETGIPVLNSYGTVTMIVLCSFCLCYNSKCFSFFNINNVDVSFHSHCICEIQESCDTEDWSNDAENSPLITGINYILKLIIIIFHSITLLTASLIKLLKPW